MALPMTRERILVCDSKSALWCFQLGVDAAYHNTACPFQPRTPHYLHWLAGWKAANR